MLHDGQGLHLVHRLALDHAGRQIGGDEDAPRLIVALDGGRPRTEGDVGHAAERHRIAAGGGDRHVGDVGERVRALSGMRTRIGT
jgi:hypothetical protein